MRTSARNRSAEAGLTLVETLIAVAILSLATGVAGGVIGALSPRLVVERAVDQLLVDLKRARLEAETAGTPVVLRIEPDGYVVNALKLERKFQSGISVHWENDELNAFAFNPGFAQLGSAITLTKGRYAAEVSIAPVSGRITRVR